MCCHKPYPLKTLVIVNCVSGRSRQLMDWACVSGEVVREWRQKVTKLWKSLKNGRLRKRQRNRTRSERPWHPSSEEASNNIQALETVSATICVNQLNRESSVCVNDCPCLVENNRMSQGLLRVLQLVASHKQIVVWGDTGRHIGRSTKVFSENLRLWPEWGLIKRQIWPRRMTELEC